MSDGKRINFAELVDVAKLQALLDSLHEVTGIANAVIDMDGVVIAHAGWQDACTQFHRVNPETCERCIESDTTLVRRMTRGESYAVYDCLNGLVDSAAPIMVAGQHVANVFTGQVLSAPPDLDFFRTQAKRFGYDEDDYLAAIARVPVIPRERMAAITRVYAELATTLANNGLDRLRQREAADELQRVNESLEQRVAERTLALRNFKAIVDSSDDAIIGKTLDGIITSWNAGAERIFGYSAGEAIGQPMQILIPPGRDNEEIEILARIAGGGRVEHFETVRRRKDGRVVDISATISPILDEHGAVCGASKIARDISARKAAEAELATYRHRLELLVAERTSELTQAKEAAEAASRAKSTFLANMSHELRTPMNAIMGLTGLAIRHARDDKLRDQVGKIDHASRHLLNVINDILDISKIEAERLTLEQAEFRFGAVLENISSIIRHKAAEKGLGLIIDVAPELAMLTLRSDPLRLSQVLLNLAGNAVKFTETGNITLRAALVEPGADQVLLRCEVIDSGIGISAADQARLFTAFEQADSGMTRKYGGTGLGLAISKRLVKLMGGEIGVVSSAGQGSTFWFTVRAGRVADTGTTPLVTAAGMAEARIRAEFSGTRILLAEDEPINQEVSRELLQDAGLLVDVAEDGALAVDMAKAANYALILMDMQMPRLNGIDATRAIRALPAYATTPILAMTANAFEEDRQTCLAAGMNDHIGKPVDPELLFTRLLKWLSQGAAAAPLPAASAPASVDRTALHDTCRRLAGLLGNNDFAGVALFEANEAVLRGGVGDEFAAIARAIRNYDFEDALSHLRAAASAGGFAL